MGKGYKQLNLVTLDFMMSAINRSFILKKLKQVKSVKVGMGNTCMITFKPRYIFHKYRPNKIDPLKHDLIVHKIDKR